MADALHFAMDYFSLKQGDYLLRWLPDRDKEIERQTTPESWRDIVESLNNPIQQRIVSDDREATNVLVLAGPGSGKTRVLVHRIAYLVRARRENTKEIPRFWRLRETRALVEWLRARVSRPVAGADLRRYLSVDAESSGISVGVSPTNSGHELVECVRFIENVPRFTVCDTKGFKVAYPRLHADVQFGAQGRVVVPAPIRKALGFQPGDMLVARVEDDHLVIEKRESVERRIRARFRKSTGRSLAEELIAERREEARRESEP